MLSVIFGSRDAKTRSADGANNLAPDRSQTAHRLVASDDRASSSADLPDDAVSLTSATYASAFFTTMTR